MKIFAIYLSIYLSVYLSIYLSIYRFIYFAKYNKNSNIVKLHLLNLEFYDNIPVFCNIYYNVIKKSSSYSK